MVQSHITEAEVVNPIREHTVLNGNFAFALCDIFQEHMPGIKQDLSVHRFCVKYLLFLSDFNRTECSRHILQKCIKYIS